MKKFNGKIASYFEYPMIQLNRKMSEHVNSNDSSEQDEDEKEDAKFVSTIRLVVGGLLLPTVAIALDKLILSRLNVIQSTLLRTSIVN